jgi:2-acylglycerol O-acyltransferase 2
MSEYFEWKVVIEDVEKLEKASPAIFALEPHDVLPVPLALWSGICGDIFPGHRGTVMVTSLCFKIPFMRQVYAWCNGYSADKSNFLKSISKGMSPAFCPGGANEIAYMKSKTECVLYLKKRFGFIKIACETGVPIVPCFCFGLQNTWDVVAVPENYFVKKLSRAIGFLPVGFFGAYGVPLGPGKQCQHIVVVGQPISVAKNASPTKEQLQAIQTQYLTALEELYLKYKDEYGMGHITLKIV